MKLRSIYCMLVTGFARIGQSSESSEMVYEHWHETTRADMAGVSKPFNLTEVQIRATPDYKYRMTVILALQLYWSQEDHVILIKSQHQKLYIAKGKEIPHLSDALNEVYNFTTKKCRELEKVYVKIYGEKVPWTEKMTKIPIEQEIIDELARKWKKIEQMFEHHNREHHKPKDGQSLDVNDYDIKMMEHEIRAAHDELSIEYEKIDRKMKKVLKLIEQQGIKILPDTVTKSQFDLLLEEVMGQGWNGTEDTVELERLVKEYDKKYEDQGLDQDE